MSAAAEAQVDEWLLPLAGATGPCGENPQYDNTFLALTLAVEGKPESQFEPARPPDWPAARVAAAALFERCRDLRVAIGWTRALLALEGLPGLASGLRLIAGLIDQHWDAVHPQLEDGDAFLRGKELAVLSAPNGVIAELRQARIVDHRLLGQLTLRGIEVALGNVSARSGETVLTKEQVVQMLAGAIQAGLPLRADMQGALDQVRALTAVCAARLGVQHAPDLRLFQTLLVNTMALLPPAPAAEPEGGAAAAAVADASIAASAPAAAPRPAQGLSGKVTSREEAVRAIDMVCEYLDTAEPSNPAQLLLRRSRRLINQNFLQLMKEFAPGAMADVARMMGVDPESVKIDKTP